VFVCVNNITVKLLIDFDGNSWVDFMGLAGNDYILYLVHSLDLENHSFSPDFGMSVRYLEHLLLMNFDEVFHVDSCGDRKT